MAQVEQELKSLNYLFLLREPFPPFRPDTTILFAEELIAREHSIDWMFQAKEQMDQSQVTQWQGGKAWVTATDRRPGIIHKLKKHILSFWMDLTILDRCRSRDYDFIQVRDRFFGALTGLVAAKFSGTKFFFWLSFPFPEMYSYRLESGESQYPFLDKVRAQFLKFVLYKVIMPNSDYVFVQSDQMKRDVVSNGVDGSKILPVPMGVSVSKLREWTPSDSDLMHHDGPTVLYLGTLIRDRKLDFLVRVHAEVLAQYPSAKLYLVGGGQCDEDEQLLIDEASRLDILDSIVFTGFLPVEQAWQYVHQADVCVSPFYPTPILNSTSPTKLVEYMAFGKPVVANDHPDQQVVIQGGQCGYCVPWDEVKFAEAIGELIANPQRAKDMGESGKRYVEEHRAYHAIAEKLDGVYRDLCR